MSKLTKLLLYDNNGNYSLVLFRDDLQGMNIRTFDNIKTDDDKRIMINHCRLIASFIGIQFIEAVS